MLRELYHTAVANTAEELDKIQRIAARIIALNPAGHKLLLIGGFRYRLLDHSGRFSRDIDYHWDGELKEKQQELVALAERVLIPEVQRKSGYEGKVGLASGPEAESPNSRIIELLFWKPHVASSQIILPVEVTRIVCLDPMTVRTAEGIVYATAS